MSKINDLFIVDARIQSVLDSKPGLAELIVSTESMSDYEKQSWLETLPAMTSEQVGRLFDILDTERTKLRELEEKYRTSIAEFNERHMAEWAAISEPIAGTPQA